MNTSAILEKIGLTDKEARTYLAILELGSTTVKPIAERAGLQRTSIYNFINNLISQGLVTQASVRGRRHYQAVTPTRILEIQREKTKLLEENLAHFLSLFNASERKPRIQYFEGATQMRQALY